MNRITVTSRTRNARFIVLACAGLFAASGAAAQGLPGWTKQKKIVMNTTATGANVSGEVKAYPVAVQLNAANFDFASAKADGSDLRFTNAAGAELPFEIESWNAAGKIAAAWVKTDVKGNDKSQYIVMHWGNPAAMAAGDGKRIFSKAGGWMGVWHLAEKGSAVTGGYKDATDNANHGKGTNITGEATVPGRIGPAVNLSHAAQEYIRIEGSESKDIYQLNSKATYSIWSKAKSHDVAYQAIFTKGEDGFRIHYYGLAAWSENRNKHITEPCVKIGTNFCPLKGCNANSWQGTDVKNGEWFHLVLVLDKPKVIYYVNGIHQVTWENAGTWTSGAKAVDIGNNSTTNGPRSFDGALDEARILNTPVDSNWVKLEWES